MANHDPKTEQTRAFTRRGFLGISGGFTGALLGGHFTGGLIRNAHADSAGTSKKESRAAEEQPLHDALTLPSC